MNHTVNIRQYPAADYESVWQEMMIFTRNRDEQTPDEIWQVQHLPVFTLGLAGKTEHVLDAGDVPVIHTDRGGQVTYHAPGQLVVYLLMDLSRRGITVKNYVWRIEQALLDLCTELGIEARRKHGAPGIYVAGKKLAALGIRVKHGCSYHGLALNVDMDLCPYQRINPCGYTGLEVTQLADLGLTMTVDETFNRLLPHLLGNLHTGTSSSAPVQAAA